MPTTDFQEVATGTDGGITGYLWRLSANWTQGVPVAGDQVVVDSSAGSYDDIANLSLAAVTMSQSDFYVTGSLTIGVLTFESTGDYVDAADGGKLTVGSLSGASNGHINADGTGSLVDMLSSTDPGELYFNSGGAEVVLDATPSPNSFFEFDQESSNDSTFAFRSPGATISSHLTGVGIGDAIALPGSDVVSVTYGGSSLTIATNLGTTTFSDVSYFATTPTAYEVTTDAATGLLRVTFQTINIFTDVSPQPSGPLAGYFLWSNAANWTTGVPLTSDSVTISSTFSVDDIASLSLNLLTPIGNDGIAVTGSQLTVADLAAASGTDFVADAALSGTPVTVTVGAISGSGATYSASGSGATFVDNSAIDTGNDYSVEVGGFFELRAAPVAASTFAYEGDGTFAFFNPGSNVAAELEAVSDDDALELPGSLLPGAVTFGASSLTILDSGVTYKFSNVIYSGTVNGYVSWIDGVTGLVEITFTGPNWNSLTASNKVLQLSNYLNVTGGGDTIYFSNASGNVVVLYGTSYNFDNVYGSGTVDLESAQTTVSGGGDAIYFAGGTGNAVSLYGTGGSGDAVYGSSGTIYLTSAQASIVGGFDTIYFSGGSGNSANLYDTGGDSDTVYGSNGTVYLGEAQANVVGGSNTIYFYGSSGNSANLSNTGGHSDTVYGSSGSIALTGAQVSVVGGGDTTYFSGGTGNAVSLFNTGGVWDSVYGSSGTVDLTSAQTSVWGGGDTIYFSGGSGNVASLYNTNTAWDTVYGSNSTVALTDAQSSLIGNGNSIDFYGTNNWLSASGGSDALVFQPAIGQDTINGFAASDSMTFSASDFANFAALSPHISQSGSSTLISLDANDTVTLTNTLASSLTSSQFHFE